MVDNNKGFSWQHLIIGILYLLAGIVVFNNPLLATLWLSVLIGIGWIISGVLNITMRDTMKEWTGRGSGWLVFFGIVDIILGLLLLFNQWVGLVAIPMLFALWFVVEAVGLIMSSFAWRSWSKGRFWLQMLVGILGLIMAVVLVFNPLGALLTLEVLVGAFFILAAITHIIIAF
ncbi:HdeD family acid-resistance protein [Aerococcus kribbianus]|uniref:DUF308 domain-containing protein n=1 Tax=Aerococcus kribbianus TaxID=2999064 RepID=A0A9X3FMW5_9LACT|nr:MULTISPECIES: DUF308 domain-containing protein [unclassified Aerococcus]MCZ0717405.1 DUF308 domain-containing protein [Aerococcus sp. YH-aer221]MCZ0725693.1 DUF308 domain-containing protein [Aerococcus sp. YH-aer222]